MNSLLPWWGFILVGAFLGTALVLLAMVPVILWLGLPRKRERELEAALENADEETARAKAMVGVLRAAERLGRDAAKKKATSKTETKKGVLQEVDETEVPKVQQVDLASPANGH